MATLLDDFNRADESPLSGGGNWAQIPGGTVSGSLRLISNQVTSTALSRNGMYWTPATALTDCEVEVTVAVVPTSGKVIALWLRINTTSGACYFMQWIVGGACGIFRNTGTGGSTTIATTTPGTTIQTGDVINFSVTGTSLVVKRNGTTIVSGTDSTYASGAIGAGGSDTTFRIDDFSGVTGVAYTESATISGSTSITATESTDDVDSNTVSGLTTVAGSEVLSFDYIDADTVSGVTALSVTEVFGHADSSTIPGNITLSSTDVADYVDAKTVNSFTHPSAIIGESISVPTFDYNWVSWAAGYTYDGSAQAVAGSVGSNDDDSGLIL